jgi:NADPH:quinone reductase-like Zn-dependent oxidoreductase
MRRRRGYYTSRAQAAHGNGAQNEGRVNRVGPLDVIAIEDIAVPSPGEQDVLVRVRASGVGPWDALVRTGKSRLPLTLPVTLGSEISGIVEGVGGKTSGFAVGDEVFGATNPLFVDGYAEHIATPSRRCLHVGPIPAPRTAESSAEFAFVGGVTGTLLRIKAPGE